MKTASAVPWLSAIAAVAAAPHNWAGSRPSSFLDTATYIVPTEDISVPFIPAREQDRVAILEASGNSDNSNVTEANLSRNWSGGILTSSGDGYTSVSATFTVPTPQPPSASATPASGSTTYAGAAWVGIDGAQNQAALLQAGVSWRVTTSGERSYNGWVEWFPASSQPISGWSVTAGDSVSVSCQSTSATSGTCTLKNGSNGQTVTRTLTAPSSSSTLTGKNAEFIVEDFEQNGQQVPFANFGSVQFSSCSAGTSGGATVTAAGAELVDLGSNGKAITSVSEPDSTDIVVTYTG